jgi:GT2 family glycosyltransferase
MATAHLNPGPADLENLIGLRLSQREAHPMSEPLVSVVVVTFESEDDIGECVRSVLASAVPLEIIVVDNASSDRTVDCLAGIMADHPACRVIRNTENRGFAKGVNQGILASRADYILVLNPDCSLASDAIELTLGAFQGMPAVAMAGCMLLNTDGTEQAGARRYLPTPWRALVRVLQLHRFSSVHPGLKGFLMDHEPIPAHPAEVEATSGAFMLVRREAIEQVGPLDEGYFMHCEDLDWCFRFRQAGWKILFVPQARAIHKKACSSRARPIRVELYKHRGMIRFYRKFFRDRYPLLLMWGVAAAVWTRFALKATLMLLQKAWAPTSPPGQEVGNPRRYVG